MPGGVAGEPESTTRAPYADHPSGFAAHRFSLMILHKSWQALVSMNRSCFKGNWHPGLKAGAASPALTGAEVQPLTGPDWAVPSRRKVERKGADDAELETHPTLNDAVRARQGADFRH
jgi:hypothetical protein